MVEKELVVCDECGSLFFKGSSQMMGPVSYTHLLLWAIWGPSSENGGSKAIKTAPKELKEKYQQVFA